jgi:Spy/CpxP family protein refolding chaperone
MNRWMQKTVLVASVAGVLAALPAAVAYAHEGNGASGEHARRGHGREGGLVHAALKLDSLSADQRASIEQLVQAERAARVPVRQADAQVLTTLAGQVQGGGVDAQALAPSLATEQSAADAEAAAERDALAKLHAILTPAQRAELADRIASRASHGKEHAQARGDAGAGERRGARFGRDLDLTAEQRAQIRAALGAGAPRADGGAGERGEHAKMLEAFRGDSFDPAAFVVAHNRGQRTEKLAAAMVPVLTPAQRDAFANHLRQRAAKESASHGA